MYTLANSRSYVQGFLIFAFISLLLVPAYSLNDADGDGDVHHRKLFFNKAKSYMFPEPAAPSLRSVASTVPNAKENATVPLSDASFLDSLTRSRQQIESIVQEISDRWEISKYPNFLKSLGMTHTAWEVLKLKFQSKILAAAELGKSKSPSDKSIPLPVTFVMSFMGSSVTAGHDSMFNVSFTEKIGRTMSPAFAPLGIKLISRNSALGNNPCLPYDACVKPFAGADADLIHWEQSYNCQATDDSKIYVFEQFIRQSLALKSKPVVVFTDSSTPNWGAKDCPKDKDKEDHPRLSAEEQKLLKYLGEGDIKKIVTEINAKPVGEKFSSVLRLFADYKMAGIQVWDHTFYESYKCRGPYVPDWSCCKVASWHPSILGHELRAAHHSFFWLLILRDAVVDLQDKISKKMIREVMLEVIHKRIDSEHKHLPTKALHKTEYSDDMQCFTTFQPRYDDTYALEKLVIPPPQPSKQGFQFLIYEELEKSAIIPMARSRGYLDFKYMLWGNKTSGALNFRIHAKKRGILFVCQPCGNWGKLPQGFDYFWKVGTKLYLTENTSVAPDGTFSFNADKAKSLTYTNHNPKDTQTICVDTDQPINAGNHLLSIVPTSSTNIMISYLLVP